MFVISLILIVFWVLINNFMINRRKLFSYLSFSEFTAINVKIDYLNANKEKAIDWRAYRVVDPKNVNKIIIITEARSGSSFLGLHYINYQDEK